jgi:hypothetical protein
MQPLFLWKNNEYSTTSVCVFVALGIQHVMPMRHIVVFHNLSVCVCSLSYPAYNAHAPYCHLWPAQLYNIFQHFFINGTILEKRKFTQNVFRFSLQHLSNTFSHFTKKWARYDKQVFCSPRKSRLILVRFNETCILMTDFRKILKYKILWKPVQYEPSCSMWTEGRTDRQTWWS